MQDANIIAANAVRIICLVFIISNVQEGLKTYAETESECPRDRIWESEAFRVSSRVRSDGEEVLSLKIYSEIAQMAFLEDLLWKSIAEGQGLELQIAAVLHEEVGRAILIVAS